MVALMVSIFALGYPNVSYPINILYQTMKDRSKKQCPGDAAEKVRHPVGEVGTMAAGRETLVPFIEPSEQADQDRSRGDEKIPACLASHEGARDACEQTRHEHTAHGKAKKMHELVEVRDERRTTVARNR